MAKRRSWRPALWVLALFALVLVSPASAEVGGDQTLEDGSMVGECGTGMGTGDPVDQGDPDDYDLGIKGSLNIAGTETEIALIVFTAWLTIL